MFYVFGGEYIGLAQKRGKLTPRAESRLSELDSPIIKELNG